MGDGVSIQDTDFRILYQNQNHKKLIGEHIGEYCYKAYEYQDKICEGCPVAMSFKDSKVHIVERSANTEKGIFHVEITASPLLDEEGNIIAGIEIVRDITNRKKIENALNESEKRYKKLTDSVTDYIYLYIYCKGRKWACCEDISRPWLCRSNRLHIRGI